ncbi:hypothetical protein OESDEN_23096 [Oesophagostomum dentatum]|uniref:Uncharacterized protein n=1 Tax=Oesophagostomum dentatum TaxID=61180 RepID=A0A0B1RX70_OESDE|nr:hypothetical protein OESDEN_23096 [Oesophagostomum dentatum]
MRKKQNVHLERRLASMGLIVTERIRSIRRSFGIRQRSEAVVS